MRVRVPPPAPDFPNGHKGFYVRRLWLNFGCYTWTDALTPAKLKLNPRLFRPFRRASTCSARWRCVSHFAFRSCRIRAPKVLAGTSGLPMPNFGISA